MGTPAGAPTTGLLQATQYLKDNRLLPRGFDKPTAAAGDRRDRRRGGRSGLHRRRRSRPLPRGGGRRRCRRRRAALPADRLPLGAEPRAVHKPSSQGSSSSTTMRSRPPRPSWSRGRRVRCGRDPCERRPHGAGCLAGGDPRGAAAAAARRAALRSRRDGDRAAPHRARRGCVAADSARDDRTGGARQPGARAHRSVGPGAP